LTGSGGVTGQLSFDNNEIRQYGSNLYMSAIGNGVAQYGNMYLQAGVSAHSTRMFISASGNVGIGTTTPDNPLHISYNSSAAEDSVQNNTGQVGLQIENTNASGVAAIHLRSSDSDGYIMYDDNGSNNGDFFFKTDGQDGDSVLTLKDNGNVGIGTESPTTKLDVTGDIRATGDIIAQRYIVSSSVTHLTQSFSSGSTIFGDTPADDTHQFTGSVSISGSGNDLNVGGNITTLGTGSFGEINLEDNKKIKIGTGDDLQIHHNGTNSYIQDKGTGALYIDGTEIRIRQQNDGGTLAVFTQGAGGQLNYGNSKKFETTAGGVDITGHITASGNISASGNIIATDLTLSDDLFVNGGVIQFGTATDFQDSSGENYMNFGSNLKVDIGDTGGSTNSTILSIDDNNNKVTVTGDAPQVVIGGTTPATNQELTVVGEISASSTITSKTGFVGETQTTGSYDFPGAIVGYNAQGVNVADDSYDLTTGYAHIDGDNIKVQFVAPKSGNVEIEVNIYCDGGSTGNADLFFGLTSNLSIGGYSALASYHEHNVYQTIRNAHGIVINKWVITGLTPGTTYKYFLAAKVNSTAGTPKLYWGGNTNDEYPPVIMKATALPSNADIET